MALSGGAAYVFTKTGATWATTTNTKLVASSPAEGELFGCGVSLCGDVAAIGAYGNSSNQGAAYVFHFDGSNWSQKTVMTDANGVGGDSLGWSIALSGQTVVAGAHGDDVDTVSEGSVCIFGNVLGGQMKQTWAYSETGNHSSIVTNGATLGFAHDDSEAGKGGLANEITAVNSSSANVAHDLAGNMTKVPTVSGGGVVGHRKCTYDAWGRLVEVKNDQDTVISAMAYDGLGRRITKTITGSGDMNHTYKYFYDGQRVIETHNASDQVIKHEVYGPTYVDEVIQVGVNDNPTVDNNMDDFHIVLDDANFNVVGIMNDSHDLIERREYTPYGKRQVFVNGSGDDDYTCTAAVPHPQVVKLGGTTAQAYSICDHGHQGLMHDKETGLINIRTRYLDAILCRHISRDFLEYIDGNNMYTRLMDSSPNYRDWTGAVIDIRAPYRNDSGGEVSSLTVRIERQYGVEVSWEALMEGITVDSLVNGDWGSRLRSAGSTEMDPSHVVDEASAVRWMLASPKSYMFSTAANFDAELAGNIAMARKDAKNRARVIAAQDKARQSWETAWAAGLAQQKKQAYIEQQVRKSNAVLATLAETAIAMSKGQAPQNWRFLEDTWKSVFEHQGAPLYWDWNVPDMPRLKVTGPIIEALDRLPREGREVLIAFLDQARRHRAEILRGVRKREYRPDNDGTSPRTLQEVINNPGPLIEKGLRGYSKNARAIRAATLLGSSLADLDLSPKETFVYTAAAAALWYTQQAVSNARKKLRASKNAVPTSVDGHHPWPKYLGGPPKQKLEQLPTELHQTYHGGLDRLLPRQRSAKFYRRLSGVEQAVNFEKFRKYTQAFDAKYGTKLWDAVKKVASAVD